MKCGTLAFRGSVLPAILVVSLLMLIGLGGLMNLWQQRALLDVKMNRHFAARADAESAYAFYRFYPRAVDTLRGGMLQLYDSLPGSRVGFDTSPWGLYELVRVTTADSVLRTCRLMGIEPDARQTLYYADNRSALTLAGGTVLHGMLRLPRNGVVYGRVNSDFYNGEPLPQTVLRHSTAAFPEVLPEAQSYIRKLFAACRQEYPEPPDSLVCSFVHDSAAVFALDRAELANCCLAGPVVLWADELRVDASCRMKNVLLCGRKITVGAGARIGAQLFAADTVVVESEAVLEYPSGIYAQGYVRLDDGCEVDGYVIVRDTVERRQTTASYRQARTARLRGLLWVEGRAQVQGLVTGRAVIGRAVYFSPQGYYRDMLYDAALLENPLTVQPLWEASGAGRRKEAAWLD